MNQLSDRLNSLSPSATLAMSQKSSELKAQGVDVINLSVGEPDFNTPDHIKEAAKQAIDENYSRYSPVAGYPALRNAIVAKLKNENGLEYTAAQISCANGAKQSVCNTIMALINKGDEVIVPAPYWVSYPEMVKLCGGKPVFVSASDEADFKVTPDQLEAAITDKTKLIILNTPSNPTGSVYSKEELKAIADLAIEKNLLIMSDEIYSSLTYDGCVAYSPAEISDEAWQHTIIVSGFSKEYSMTGWRLGTMCAPDDIAKAVANIQSQTTSNATTFAQFGALAALENPKAAKESLDEMLKVFDRRRLALFNGLNSIDGISCRRAKGAFYLFPNISSFGMSSSDFCAKLLEEELVALVPGFAFGSDSNVRFSYAVADLVIEKGLERMRKFCARL